MPSAWACAAGIGFVSVLLQGCGGGGATPTTTTVTTTTWANSGAQEGAFAGEFETYVLALEFQPQWSQGHCDTLASQKLDGKGGVFAQTQMSVHGMWPNYDRALHDGYQWPAWCGSFQECNPGFEAQQCRLDPAQIDAFNTSENWQTYSLEYAWGNLAEHEWAKHGSCVGNVTQQQYFAKVQQFVFDFLGKRLFANRAILGNVGANVSYDDLQSLFSEGGYVALQCDDCHLTDAWYLVGAARDADGLLMPNTSDFLDYPSRGSCELCTGGVHITNWTAEGCHEGLTSEFLT